MTDSIKNNQIDAQSLWLLHKSEIARSMEAWVVHYCNIACESVTFPMRTVDDIARHIHNNKNVCVHKINTINFF